MNRVMAILGFGLMIAGSALAAPAPAFELADTKGDVHKLSDYAGKFVVLEWYNPDCPFVKKHHLSGSMAGLQTKWAEHGVIWLAVNSSAPGKQGNYTGTEHEAILTERGAKPTALLLDADGTVGHAYGARTTPHMFVIDPAGEIIYQGAIDDKPTADQADLEGARNHVDSALEEALNGQPVSVASSDPYGCSVKY